MNNKDNFRSVAVVSALVIGIVLTVGVAVSIQTNSQNSQLQSNPPSPDSINSEETGSAYTTVTTTVSGSTISIPACSTEPYVLNIIGSLMAQPNVVSAEDGYASWVEQVSSNESGTLSFSGVAQNFVEMQIDIDSLKPNAPVMCNVPNQYLNLQLALIVPFSNGQFNITAVKVAVVGPIQGTNTANLTGVSQASNTSE